MNITDIAYWQLEMMFGFWVAEPQVLSDWAACREQDPPDIKEHTLSFRASHTLTTRYGYF